MSSTPLPKKPVLGLLLKDLIYNTLVTTYLIPIKKYLLVTYMVLYHISAKLYNDIE